ncbi:MAG: energy transducer TonB [Flavobacteriales bacterium]|nr:energy transducer TonB [Flavobacteriales bacterium]
MKYPEEELKNGRSGMVVVEFLIRADGSIQGPSVVRSVSTALDREALRIVSTMPPWIPAKAGGRAVATKQQVPVRFTIR